MSLTSLRHLAATFALTGSALAAAFLLPSPANAWGLTIVTGDDDGKAVVGSGHVVDAKRTLGAFSKLSVEGSVDIDARPGTSPTATVRTDDNIAPFIETTVEGDTLHVRVKHGTSFRTHETLKVIVEFTQLTDIQQRGSGDVHVFDLTSPRLESEITGSGDLKVDHAQLGELRVGIAGSGDVAIEGHADEAHFHVAGSGDIHAERFAAHRVEVSVSGSGDAHVNAIDSLDAHVAGSGDVTFRGHPHDVTRHVAGSGSVEAED
ncbi:MAG TPA: head GIN domain-containing protein [Burkholderiaceae bacterium]|jgi:hypothetical protein|nr:head GIN domain-containing protein [Burkholderiaceae bacterium]